MKGKSIKVNIEEDNVKKTIEKKPKKGEIPNAAAEKVKKAIAKAKMDTTSLDQKKQEKLIAKQKEALITAQKEKKVKKQVKVKPSSKDASSAIQVETDESAPSSSRRKSTRSSGVKGMALEDREAEDGTSAGNQIVPETTTIGTQTDRWNRTITLRSELLDLQELDYNPPLIVPKFYMIVEEFYQKAGGLQVKSEEHITLQLSLELAKDFTDHKDNIDKTKTLWTVLSGGKDQNDDTPGDSWKTQIKAIQGQKPIFHCAPSNKSFEWKAGYDVVWFFQKTHTLYLQAKIGDPDTGNPPKFTYNDCRQLMALKLTQKGSKATGHTVFVGYIIYGTRKLWLIPLKEILAALKAIYANSEWSTKVGPDANLPFQNQALSEVFCTTEYELGAILGKILQKQALPTVANILGKIKKEPPARKNKPALSLKKVEENLLKDIDKANKKALADN